MPSPSPPLLSLAVVLVVPLVSAQAETEERVPIRGFEIDRTEVTIGRFRAFAETLGFETEAERTGGGFEWDRGWRQRPGWTVYRPFGQAPDSLDEPAVHLSWQEAADYCAWRGGRLPTLEEWRLAAYSETRAEPDEGFETGRTYRYPVGDAPEGMNTSDEAAWPRHAPVGETRRGVNGLYDMGGNVWEWIADRRGGDALTAGGSWWYGPRQTTADAMQWKPAEFYAVYVGFRCVYDPE